MSTARLVASRRARISATIDCRLVHSARTLAVLEFQVAFDSIIFVQAASATEQQQVYDAVKADMEAAVQSQQLTVKLREAAAEAGVEILEQAVVDSSSFTAGALTLNEQLASHGPAESISSPAIGREAPPRVYSQDSDGSDDDSTRHPALTFLFWVALLLVVLGGVFAVASGRLGEAYGHFCSGAGTRWEFQDKDGSWTAHEEATARRIEKAYKKTRQSIFKIAARRDGVDGVETYPLAIDKEQMIQRRIDTGVENNIRRVVSEGRVGLSAKAIFKPRPEWVSQDKAAGLGAAGAGGSQRMNPLFRDCDAPNAHVITLGTTGRWVEMVGAGDKIYWYDKTTHQSRWTDPSAVAKLEKKLGVDDVFLPAIPVVENHFFDETAKPKVPTNIPSKMVPTARAVATAQASAEAPAFMDLSCPAPSQRGLSPRSSRSGHSAEASATRGVAATRQAEGPTPKAFAPDMDYLPCPPPSARGSVAPPPPPDFGRAAVVAAGRISRGPATEAHAAADLPCPPPSERGSLPSSPRFLAFARGTSALAGAVQGVASKRRPLLSDGSESDESVTPVAPTVAELDGGPSAQGTAFVEDRKAHGGERASRAEAGAEAEAGAGAGAAAGISVTARRQAEGQGVRAPPPI